MNKLFCKVVSIILLGSLLLTSLPIAAGVSYAESAEKQQSKQEKNNKVTEKRKKEMKDSYSISDDEIQAILDEGYTLDEAESALGDQQRTKGALKESLEKIKPSPVNVSKDAESKIQSDLGVEKYTAPTISAATTDPVPDYSYVNTSPDTAPYTIKLDQESISTLSGGLSMQNADMSLPGRNGLGFTLTRTYDSDSSQFNQMVTYGDSNGTIQSFEEKFFPIGKGWTWNISYIDVTGSSLYLHLGGAGVYKIVNYNLVGYPWRDLTFTPDSTVTVGTIKSAYALHSTKGITQYFDAKGHLLQYADTFNNTVLFNYTEDPTYGTVLSSIVDAIGNSINITYSKSAVVIKKGTETVTYNKTTVNGKELLSQVVDAAGRKTTYDYYMKDAFFNLVGTYAYSSNPYALLIGVTHPTGSKTMYSYEDTATLRRTGINAVNQVFRATSREDQITLSDGRVEHYNHKDISYAGDMGSTYDADIPSFSTTIKDGLTMSVFTNKKHYIDANTPAVFYNMNQVSSSPQDSPSYTVTTNYTYDETNKYPSPISTEVIKSAQGNVNPSTITTRATYDPFGNVTGSVDVLGGTTTYTYDNALHLLVGVSKPISTNQTQYTEYVRDAAHGNVTAVRVRDGNVTGTVLQETINEDYDPYGNAWKTKVKKDAANYTTFQTEYNAAAPYSGAYPTKQTISVRDANGVLSTIIKQYDYNTANGQLKTFIDGKTQSTTYEYDGIGRVTKAIQPDNSFVKVDYFDFQNQVQQTDETGVQTLTKWNPLGWKVDAGIIDRGIYKSKAKYSYDKYGRMEATEDALGNKTSYGYDHWSRQNLIRYPDASTASVQYDDMNNTKAITDAEGNSIKEYADKAGRTTSKEETKKLAAGGTKTTLLGTFTFDNMGNVLTATDNQTPQNTTIYNYDTIGNLTSVKNAKNEITSYQYDSLGNMLQVTYPDNKVNSKIYDEIGRLIQTSDANGKIEKFFYDANGNQMGLLDRNSTYFKYTFDERNFLKKKEITDASWVPLAGEEAISFTYDLAGRRKQMMDATGTTSYDYTPSTGALNTQTYADGKTIKYDYDAAGNRFVMNDPFGVNTYYHYDSRNRLDIVAPSADFLKDTESSKTTDFEARYSYFNNSLLKQITQRNGVTSEFAYDGLRIGTLTEKKSNGTILNEFKYTYDNNGNQDTKKEQLGSEPVLTNSYNFTYDKLNRITTSDQFNETYTYDNRGNRSDMTTSNPFDSPDATRTFDKRDRLTNVALTIGGNVTYKYNGDGLLWERTENGQKTRYYWDGDQIIAEGNVSGEVVTLKARYIRGQGLVAREDGQGKAYYLQNGHGDVVNLMDSTGMTKLNSYSYDIWGNIVSQQENLPQSFKYSGEMMDDKIGLQYLRARWYDPSMGRFVGEDTYGGQVDNPLSENLFTYVENNPLTNVDPSGHNAVSDFVKYALPETLSALKNITSGISQGAAEGSRAGMLGAVTGVVVGGLLGNPTVAGGDYTPSEIRDITNSNSKTKSNVTPYVDTTTSDKNKKKRILFHYTSQAGYEGIMSTYSIFPSLKVLRPSDARYGDGVYFTDIAPDTMTSKQLSQAFYNKDNQADRVQWYIAVDVSDLDIKPGRPGVYVYNTNTPLSLVNRFVSAGYNFGPSGPANGYDFSAPWNP